MSFIMTKNSSEKTLKKLSSFESKQTKAGDILLFLEKEKLKPDPTMKTIKTKKVMKTMNNFELFVEILKKITKSGLFEILMLYE